MSASSLVIPEMHLIGVADPGVPNQERVALRPTQKLKLAGYGIAVGLPAPVPGAAYPLIDNCFWFPDLEVNPPCWILVFTGKGTTSTSKWQNEDVISLHWQRPFTIFANRLVVPVLFRVGGATVGQVL